LLHRSTGSQLKHSDDLHTQSTATPTEFGRQGNRRINAWSGQMKKISKISLSWLSELTADEIQMAWAVLRDANG
jgi:hypothetical protein